MRLTLARSSLRFAILVRHLFDLSFHFSVRELLSDQVASIAETERPQHHRPNIFSQAGRMQTPGWKNAVGGLSSEGEFEGASVWVHLASSLSWPEHRLRKARLDCTLNGVWFVTNFNNLPLGPLPLGSF